MKITCQGTDLLPLDSLEEFQGTLKKRSKKDIDNIIKSINKYGFSFPFFVWNGDGHNNVLDGHGRILALAEMRKRGEDLPLFPVVYIDAENEAEAKQKLLRCTSQYGEMTIDSVLEFTNELEIDFDELSLANGVLEFNKTNTESELKDISDKLEESYEVVCECSSEQHQEEIYETLQEMGIKCRILTL